MHTKTKSVNKVNDDAPMEQLEIGGATYQTRLTNKFRNREKWSRPDERKVLAIIPGTIQRITVSEGEEVDPGTPLLILEAMKMRNEIVSPDKGIIRKIYVSVGEQVSKAQLLVEFK
jgi:biotin carboxyl carrier protein